MHDVASSKIGAPAFAPVRVRSLASGTVRQAYSGELLGAQVFQGSAPETYPVEVAFPERSLVYSRSGSWVLGGMLVPQGHVGLTDRGVVHGVVSAGSLDLVILNWRHEAMPWLEGAIRHILGAKHRIRPAELPPLPDALVAGELKLLSVVIELVALLLAESSRICIRPCPADAGVFSALLAEVDATPDRVWNLQEAADQAGYSPFHFSRTFKQQIGCGFHEYVDRLRTETAVMCLLEGGALSDAVARAGFSTARSLRESLKDYLGLLPGDLRSHD